MVTARLACTVHTLERSSSMPSHAVHAVGDVHAAQPAGQAWQAPSPSAAEPYSPTGQKAVQALPCR
eukprot:scaffold95876_cov63-Phaeocystis_antarctica.AAC.3